jgi:hypothetical protein
VPGIPAGSAGGTSAPASVAATPNIVGIRSGHVYSRRSAPRLLTGIARVLPGGTLHDVRIRLERRQGGRCFDFSGSRAAFVRARRCNPPSFFSVGATETFSYLLPARLSKGRYVFDIEAIDISGQATKLIPGVSHVVFRVL